MREDTRRVAKIVGGALVALTVPLLFLFAGYGLGTSGGYYDAQADSYAAQIGAASDERVERCFAQSNTSVPSTRECVEQAVLSSREEQRSEQDLSAQRQMAHWAFWLLIATIAQMPLSVLGLVLVLQTIRQGQKALGLQESETRPWLSFQNLEVRYLHVRKFDDGGWLIQPVLEVEIVNSGTMPAGEVRAFAHAINNPISNEAVVEVEGLVQGQIAVKRGFTMGVLPPNGKGIFKTTAAPYAMPETDGLGASHRDAFPGILLSVMYRAIGDETIRQTVQVFRLSYGDPTMQTDSHSATGFWLAHKSYEPGAITIVAGSKMDRAT